MKAAMPGNQILPAKLASKDSLARKETAARPSAQRFDDVLSGVKAASRAPRQSLALHPPANPLAKSPTTQAMETRRSQAEEGEGEWSAGGGLPPSAPQASGEAPQGVATSEPRLFSPVGHHSRL